MNVTKLGRKLRYYLALSQVLSRADKVNSFMNYQKEIFKRLFLFLFLLSPAITPDSYQLQRPR